MKRLMARNVNLNSVIADQVGVAAISQKLDAGIAASEVP